MNYFCLGVKHAFACKLVESSKEALRFLRRGTEQIEIGSLSAPPQQGHMTHVFPGVIPLTNETAAAINGKPLSEGFSLSQCCAKRGKKQIDEGEELRRKLIEKRQELALLQQQVDALDSHGFSEAS